jgi:DNA-binding helix-hairpin-helix protein with protein kinase domain
MSVRSFVDQRNRPIVLGAELGGGGEGKVFDVASLPEYAAKVYHKAPSAEQQGKLRALVDLATDDLLKVAAWPTATLHERPGGPVVGMIMPKVKERNELHTLYSPAQRKSVFPHADWNFLIHTAMNCAIAFDAIHRVGVVMGDVNQSNVMVFKQGVVVLIDCDSFQVEAHGRRYFCEVGVPIFTPPELQSLSSFHGVPRTPNHDRFGLALLIFHLLFMGRHPFSGRFTGKGEMPLERAIGEYRFAYGLSAASSQMQPPPASIPMTAIPPELGAMFERAFNKSSGQPNARPRADEWAGALNSFRKQLKSCTVDPGHVFLSSSGSCPWCLLMRAGAPNLFVSVALTKAGGGHTGPAFVLAVAWTQIEKVPRPSTAYQRPVAAACVPRMLPAGLPAILPPRKRVPQDSTQRIVTITVLVAGGFTVLFLPTVRVVGVFSLISFVVFAVWWAVLEWFRREQEAAVNVDRDQVVAALVLEAEKRRGAVQKAEKNIKAGEHNWTAIASRAEQSFKEKLRELKAFRDRHAALQQQYTAERQNLERRAWELQRDQHLQKYFIVVADISNIGPARKATLSSYGIETALDVKPEVILEVPGFGPALTDRLVQWRAQVEAGFQYNAAAGIPPAEQQALTLKYRQLGQQLEIRLQAGPTELGSISAQVEKELRQTREQIRAWIQAWTQADADLSMLPAGV